MKPGTKGGKSTLESWLKLSAMEDKLQLDRVEMLKDSKPQEAKRAYLLGRDSAFKTVTEQLKNKQVALKQYLDRVIKIMGNFD